MFHYDERHRTMKIDIEAIEKEQKRKQKKIDRIAWKAESKQIYNKTNKGKA